MATAIKWPGTPGWQDSPNGRGKEPDPRGRIAGADRWSVARNVTCVVPEETKRAMRRLFIPAIVLTVLSAGPMAQAPRTNASTTAWWPHWRGPAQTGVAAGTAPTTWSETSNIAWKVA